MRWTRPQRKIGATQMPRRQSRQIGVIKLAAHILRDSLDCCRLEVVVRFESLVINVVGDFPSSKRLAVLQISTHGVPQMGQSVGGKTIRRKLMTLVDEVEDDVPATFKRIITKTEGIGFDT